MSGDHINYNRIGSSSLPSRRVDINDLLSRAREDEKKQRKENLVFFSLVASVIVITAIIASL